MLQDLAVVIVVGLLLEGCQMSKQRTNFTKLFATVVTLIKFRPGREKYIGTGNTNCKSNWTG